MAVQLATLAAMSDWVAAASVLALAVSAHVVVRNNRLKSRLLAQQSEANAIIENLSEGYYRAQMDGTLVYANPAFASMSGFDDPKDFLSAENESRRGQYVDPTRRAEFLASLREQGIVRELVSEIEVDDGKRRFWVTENARVVRNQKTGEALYYEGTLRDTTDIVMRMREKDALIKLTSQVPGGLFQLERAVNGTFEVVFTSAGFRELLDRNDADKKFDLKKFLSIILPDDIADYNQSLKHSRKAMTPWNHEFRVVTDGGKPKWMKVQATPEKLVDGRTVWHGYLQDVTEHKADEAQFRSLAYNDTLTGLPNRRLLLDRMQQSIAASSRRNEFGAILFIDLDNFKLLNDTHGHDTGDLLLVEISKRLSKIVRRNDTVARLAGDEFVVLLEGLGKDRNGADEKVSMISEKILASFAKGFDLGKVSYEATASIGAICFDGTTKSVDDVLKHADTAMYAVKKSGRNAYRIFNQTPAFDSGSQLQIGQDLKNIIRDKQLVLRLQPQMDREGNIVGAEALVRWNHPKLGLLGPDRFMGLAEQRGQIREISSFVLEQGIKMLAAWQADPLTRDLRLAVNVSSHQLFNTDFARELRELIKRHKAKSAKLTLELTEAVIAKNRDHAMKTMEQLKTTGVRLSLDDFGTGFSSLAHLADMPLDEIKIDGKFVRQLLDRPKDAALVKTILAMASTMGLSTVAEHVETAAQEGFLLKHGCNFFQGFLYSGAMTRDDFEEAVKQKARNCAAEMPLANVA